MIDWKGFTMKRRLEDWSRDPIHVPRWMLTLKYFAFVILGVLAVIGGIPTLNSLTFDAFTTGWSGGLVIAAAIAAVASFQKHWEGLEKWAALVVTALLVTWAIAAMVRAVGEGDVGRMAGAFSILVMSMLPAVRVLGLMKTAGA